MLWSGSYEATAMALTFAKAAVVGATGPTGKFLVRELIVRRVPVQALDGPGFPENKKPPGPTQAEDL